MASAHPPLTDDDVNFFKNKKAVDVIIPDTFNTVIIWGCKKSSTETYFEFLEKKVPVAEFTKYMNRFKADSAKLNQKDCITFDATFMLKLIPEICGNIAPSGSFVWSTVDDTRIECHLKKLKNVRNDVSHEPKGAAISPDLLTNVEEMSIKTLRLAGSLFNIGSFAVQVKIDDLQVKVNDIKHSMMTEKEIRLMQEEKLLKVDGKKEMMACTKKMSTIHLPFSQTKVTRNEVFHFNKLTLVEDNGTKMIISCDKVLPHIRNRCCLIKGQPGSGKSTLLRRLRDDFLEEKSAEIFVDVRNFAFLLFFECRSTNINNCLQLLEQIIPTTLKKLNPKEALEILQQLECLILIDGIDELNSSSHRVLDDLIVYFRRSTFVITSRPGEALEMLKRQLNDKGGEYVITPLEPMSDRDEQIEFLERYQANIPGMDAPALINAFNSLDQSCSIHFYYPLYLALFCHLFHSSPQDVTKWKDERSIMRQTLKLSMNMIKERLQTQKCKNSDFLAMDLINAAGKLSLQQLIQDKFTIEMSDYAALCKEWFGGHDVDYHSILSCIFLATPEEEAFEFLHKSHAEYMASETILKEMKEQNASIIGVISQHASNVASSKLHDRMMTAQEDQAVTDMSSSLRKMKSPRKLAVKNKWGHLRLHRYLNVIRFIVMELVEVGHQKQLTRCLEEICAALASENVGVEFWAELALSCPNSEEVGRAAAKAAKVVDHTMEGENWLVTTKLKVFMATFNLRYKQPKRLSVMLARNVDFAPALSTLLAAMALWFNGIVSLRLEHSYYEFNPCDDLLTRLSSSQCQLIEFSGCLTTLAAQRALVTATTRARAVVTEGEFTTIRIAVPDARTIELASLQGTIHDLYVRTKTVPSRGGRLANALPKGRFTPVLTVACTDGPSVKEVAGLIADLAPEDKTYWRLYLQSWPGTNESLDKLVKTLFTAGVRTKFTVGLPKYAHAPFDNGRCRACGAGSHLLGEGRCVWLILP